MKSPGVLACGMNEKERLERQKNGMAMAAWPDSVFPRQVQNNPPNPAQPLLSKTTLSLSLSIKTTRNSCNILHN
jgi:hypothetical protein